MITSILYFQVDAFTQTIFQGNPAGVCLLPRSFNDQVLLKMAMEHHLAETAFISCSEGKLTLRWFTPELEMDLCGHATLAAAHVLLSEDIAKDWLRDYDIFLQERVIFHTQSGVLTVSINEVGLYTLDLPIRAPELVIDWETNQQLLTIIDSLGSLPLEVWRARDILCVYDHAQDVQDLIPDPIKLGKVDLGTGGVITTAVSEKISSERDVSPHFISRFFTPQASLLEDYVTGSAHCTLGPFWSERLGLKEMIAYQASDRGGWINIRLHQVGQAYGPSINRIWLSGYAITYFEAQLRL